MNIIQLMVTIIIVTILVTVVLGFASYAAFWLRRSRHPVEQETKSDAPRFFFRYVPEVEVGAGSAALVGPRRRGTRGSSDTSKNEQAADEPDRTVTPALTHSSV